MAPDLTSQHRGPASTQPAGSGCVQDQHAAGMIWMTDCFRFLIQEVQKRPDQHFSQPVMLCMFQHTSHITQRTSCAALSAECTRQRVDLQ